MNDLILLASLLDGPKHGYQLKKEAGLILGDTDLHNNIVYPLLHRFEKKGWVSKKTAAGRRGQVRFQYALTPAGKKELVRRLSDYPQGGVASPEAFYLRIGLFPVLAPEVRLGVLAARENHLRAEEEHLMRLQGGLELGRYGGEVVQFLKRKARLELGWIKHLRNTRA